MSGQEILAGASDGAILADYKNNFDCLFYKQDSVKEIQYDYHFEIQLE